MRRSELRENKTITPETAERVRQAWEQGRSYSQITGKYGISPATIPRLVRSRDERFVPALPEGERRKLIRRLEKEGPAKVHKTMWGKKREAFRLSRMALETLVETVAQGDRAKRDYDAKR